MFTFVETRLFSRIVARYLSDEEYDTKNEAENIAPEILRRIREEIDG